MDLTTSLIEFLKACKDGDRYLAELFVSALKHWIEQGGALPEIQRLEDDGFEVDISIKKG